MTEPGLQQAPSDVTRHLAPPTPGAARQARYRARKRRSAIIVPISINAAAINRLVELGWLDQAGRRAIAKAVIAIAGRALELKLRPDAEPPAKRPGEVIIRLVLDEMTAMQVRELTWGHPYHPVAPEELAAPSGALLRKGIQAVMRR